MKLLLKESKLIHNFSFEKGRLFPSLRRRERLHKSDFDCFSLREYNIHQNAVSLDVFGLYFLSSTQCGILICWRKIKVI